MVRTRQATSPWVLCGNAVPVVSIGASQTLLLLQYCQPAVTPLGHFVKMQILIQGPWGVASPASSHTPRSQHLRGSRTLSRGHGEGG